jgi:hypothetical protein
LRAYHGGKDSLQDSPEDVEDISQEPSDDELNRKGISAVSLEVLYDLRGEYDD